MIGIGIVLPLIALAAFLVVMWPDLPQVVATHWDPQGRADSFVVLGMRVWLTPVLLAVCTWGLLSIAVAHVPQGGPGGRWLRALPAGAAWFVVGLACSTLLPQRGLVDAQEAPFSLTWLLAGLIAGLVGFWLIALVAPDTARITTHALTFEDESIDRDRPASVVWRSSARPPKLGYVLLALLGLLAAAAAVHVRWVVAAVLLLTVLVAAAFTSFRVSVDDQAVRVRGTFFGVPRFAVALSTIRRAEVVDVKPLHWGGWGLRYRSTGIGVVTRGGPALRLVRTDDTEVVLTVDDAASAAAILNALGTPSA